MGYGYLILAVKSEQDNFLVGNPQFTYFKAVYRRHTNFAIDFMKVNFPTDTNKCQGKLLSVDIPKVGDLLHRAYLNIQINKEQGESAPSINNYIEYIELYIGDQLIDKHTGSWLNLHNSYYENSDKITSLHALGKVPTAAGNHTITTPLRFWFNNHVGNSLPLIALQYSKVTLKIKLNDTREINTSGGSPSTNTLVLIESMNLLIENIYLDKEERRAFTTNKHEYLITQLQVSLNNNIRKFEDLYPLSDFVEDIRFKIPLYFRYPVKEIFWTIQNQVKTGGTEINIGSNKFNYWRDFVKYTDQMRVCTIELNGQELVDELPAKFFREVQRFQYHSGINDNGSYSYSFAIDPENNQPSGSLNFSKLENAFLKIGFPKSGTAPKICISTYAINYNVLRVMSGVAALEFVN